MTVETMGIPIILLTHWKNHWKGGTPHSISGTPAIHASPMIWRTRLEPSTLPTITTMITIAVTLVASKGPKGKFLNAMMMRVTQTSIRYVDHNHNPSRNRRKHATHTVSHFFAYVTCFPWSPTVHEIFSQDNDGDCYIPRHVARPSSKFFGSVPLGWLFKQWWTLPARMVRQLLDLFFPLVHHILPVSLLCLLVQG